MPEAEVIHHMSVEREDHVRMRVCPASVVILSRDALYIQFK